MQNRRILARGLVPAICVLTVCALGLPLEAVGADRMVICEEFSSFT